MCRRSANATCFGPKDAPKHFLSIKHDDPGYKYFFGELLLCFTCMHEGELHSCVFIEYVWPKDVFTADKDGVPLETRYYFPPRSTYEVRPVCDVRFCPQLAAPPPLRPLASPNALPYYYLNDDIYSNF